MTAKADTGRIQSTSKKEHAAAVAKEMKARASESTIEIDFEDAPFRCCDLCEENKAVVKRRGMNMCQECSDSFVAKTPEEILDPDPPDETAYCPECDHDSRTLSSCDRCGYPFGASKKVAHNEERGTIRAVERAAQVVERCMGCDGEVYPGAKFCGRCGMRLDTDAGREGFVEEEESGLNIIELVEVASESLAQRRAAEEVERAVAQEEQDASDDAERAEQEAIVAEIEAQEAPEPRTEDEEETAAANAIEAEIRAEMQSPSEAQAEVVREETETVSESLRVARERWARMMSRGRVPRSQRTSTFTVNAQQRQQQNAANAQIRHAMRNREIIAGVDEDQLGRILSWRGLGELTRALICEALTDAGLDAAMAPNVASATKYAGIAANRMNGFGFVSRRTRGRSFVKRNANATAEWQVGVLGVGRDADPDSLGKIALYIWVMADGSLDFDVRDVPHASDMRDEIEREFNRLRDAEVYKAGDVTAWLGRMLRDYFRAVEFGCGWYVPQTDEGAADVAERLCEAIKGKGFGRGWQLPGLGIVDARRLKDSLCNGIAEEVEEVARSLAAQREDAKNRDAKNPGRRTKSRNEGEIGARAAEGLYTRIKDIAERCRFYSEVIGTERVRTIRNRAQKLIDEIEPLCSATGIRGALIWDDIRNDS